MTVPLADNSYLGGSGESFTFDSSIESFGATCSTNWPALAGGRRKQGQHEEQSEVSACWTPAFSIPNSLSR